MLQVSGIHKRFGGTVALDDVSLDVRGGEVLALLGENGAGKSTLMKVLSGAITPDRGTMLLEGRHYAPNGPHAARRAGVAMIYQELTLAPHLSVADNIMLGQERHTLGWLDRAAQRQLVAEVLGRLGHPDLRPDTPVHRLSVAAQQLVEIARALVEKSKVIVFDEPTSSLTQRDARRLFEVIGQLKRDGMAVIYISHFLEEIRAVADRYAVLRDGKSVGSGVLADATEAHIVSLMVGRSVDELFPVVPHSPGETLLTVRSLSGDRIPQEVDLDIRRGEILGIAGLVGSGRTELLRCLYGLDPVRRGEIRLASRPLDGGPQMRIHRGLGLVSEDRKGEGLAQNQSIADNLTASHLRPYSMLGWLNLGERRRAVRHWMEQLQVKARSPEQPVSAMSGGNQQKVAIARVLHQQAEVFLLDEPTRGIDVGTKAEIYRLMGQLAAQGKAIVFVSSYLPELMAICDRIAVMRRGMVRRVLPTGSWTQESVLACALGMDEPASEEIEQTT